MDARTVDEVMRAQAEVQHGLVGRDQLRRLGVARQVVARRLASAAWEELTPRVLRLVGAAVTLEQRAMAAALDAGAEAVVSHRSAAALWGIAGFDLRRLHVSRPRAGTRRPTALAVVHHVTSLPGAHRAVRNGIPVTSLARTVVDLAGSDRAGRVERAAHAAVRLGATWADIERAWSEAGARRAGSPVLRRVLAGGVGRPPLGSGLEATGLHLLARAGLPEPRRQVDLGAGDWVGRVDFLYEAARLVVEVDGSWCHDGALDARRDRHRTAALVAAGFRVLALPEELVASRPDEAVRLVRDALRRAA